MTLQRVMCEINHVKQVFKIHSDKKKSLCIGRDIITTAHCAWCHDLDTGLVVSCREVYVEVHVARMERPLLNFQSSCFHEQNIKT